MAIAQTALRYCLGIAICLGAGATLSACSPPAENGKTTAKSVRPPHLVATAPVLRGAGRYTTVRTGTLRARRTVRIFNQEEGRITQVTSFEGDTVPVGAPLILMDDALLRAQLDKAAATRRQAEQEIRRLRELERRNLATDEGLTRASTTLEVAQAEEVLLRTRIGYTRILAPFEGIVTERLVEPGDVVPRYSHLATLSDPSSLVTDVPVSELLIPYLKEGDAVEVRIDALADVGNSGRIQRIYPNIDPKTRTGTVEIALDPVPAGARPGQLCRVTLTLPAIERKLIPFAAVRHDAAGEYVYVLGDNEKVKRQPVRSGLIFGDQIAVLDGLSEGEQIVVKGFLGLSDGKSVKRVTEPTPGAKQPQPDKSMEQASGQ